MEIFIALCAGLGLSAACGLRVFLPLFLVSIAIRMDFMVCGPSFDWLGSTPAVALFGTATVVEVIGFMIPWVDHLLDVLAAPLAAAAGAILMTSQLAVYVGDPAQSQPLLHPAVAWSLGIIVGATTASGVEAASIAGRLSSSVLSIGWLNPVFGMLETVLAFVVTLLTLWLPVVVGGVILLMIPVLLIAFWRIWVWRRNQRRAHEAKLRNARERIAQSVSNRAEMLSAARSGLAPHSGTDPTAPS